MKIWTLVLPFMLVACGERVPYEPPKKEFEVYRSEKPPEPELTLEEQLAKLEEERANQPEPELDPESAREQQKLVWDEGKSELRSIYEDRARVLEKLDRIKFDKELKEQGDAVKGFRKALDDFTIGYKVEEMDGAAQRICDLFNEIRPKMDAIEEEGVEKLRAVESQMAAMEKEAEEKGGAVPASYRRLEAERRRWSSPQLAAGYLTMAYRTVLEEAHVLVNYGARRSQIALRDCLGAEDFPAFKDELTEKLRDKAVKRSRYYVP